MKRAAVIGTACVLSVCVLQAAASAQVIERVSVSSAGVEANGESWVGNRRSISEDGRYVVFESDASNLVPDDLNGVKDVFVRDRELGLTTRVSVDRFGGDADGPSDTAAISLDGRYVVFRSAASDLIPDDFNWEWDIFMRDLALGETTRVSVNTDGGDASDDSSIPSVSADGRYVAFVSEAWNLVPGGPRLGSIYVRDMVAGETVLASVAWDGGTVEETCWAARISGDGRHVGFVSVASNIVPDDSNGLLDAFVRDLDTGVTTRVSVDRFGEDADYRSRISSLSYNGDHVGFWSTATDLVDDDTNGLDDAYVRVLEPPPAYTHRVSLTSDGQQANGPSDAVMMSVGARYVAFKSDASNLVSDDTNGYSDIFTHDRWTGLTRRVNTDRLGNEAGDWSGSPYISGDNRFVVFRSYAQNLVDGDTNGWGDIFVAHGPVMLFMDSFESGDTSTWSSSSP